MSPGVFDEHENSAEVTRNRTEIAMSFLIRFLLMKYKERDFRTSTAVE